MMNYIKKIKSLGFKRHDPTALCSYEYSSSNKIGYYLKPIVEILNEPNLNRRKYLIDACRRDTNSYELERLQTYMYKICEGISMYISIDKLNYIAFIDDKHIKDSSIRYNNKIIEKKNIYILHYSKLNPGFWNDILNSLDVAIRRQIKLNQIWQN